jgi:polyhydroxybutyrate depolymerase
MVLHGGGGSGEQVRESTGLAEAGVRAGFVVVFPDGTGPLRTRLLTWNSGGIPVYAAEHDVDDVAFLRAVVADVQRRVPIDAARVFATGHSNGAHDVPSAGAARPPTCSPASPWSRGR